MIDLSKCLDSVLHGILLQMKLVNYGITNTEYSWFKSYLNKRQQVVNFNNKQGKFRQGKFKHWSPTGNGPWTNFLKIYMNEF